MTSLQPINPSATSRSSGRQLLTIDNESSFYPVVCHFVANQYQHHFQARLKEFMPRFIVLMNDGRVVAAAGYRIASSGPLFLEQYLSTSIEAALEESLSDRIDRHKVVEIGQLAVEDSSLLGHLFTNVAIYLNHRGLEHLVCTGTRTMATCLKQAGFSPKTLAFAGARQVTGTTDWGNYYDHKPRVLSGLIGQGVKQLRLSGVPLIPWDQLHDNSQVAQSA